MAIFGKEPDKNSRVNETLKTPPSTAAATPNGEDRTPIRLATPAPHEGDGRAYLDRGSKVSGKLSFDGPARIDGQVDGEIHAKESIMIGESAVVTAQIKAASVVVAGKVSGDIVAGQRIEIRPSAKVLGNLTSPILVIHEGALFEGHCAMQAESPRDNKVAVFPKEERLAQVQKA
jgi:cytoskeletal protein CcmA (bactofilin family)